MQEEDKPEKELITQQAWSTKMLKAKPVNSKLLRWALVLLKRFALSEKKRPSLEGPGAHKRYTEVGLKRMQDLSVVMWSLTANGQVTFCDNFPMTIRAPGESIASVTKQLITAADLFREGKPFSREVQFLQTEVETPRFLLSEGQGLPQVYKHLSFQALVLWNLAGYARLKEEECEPDSYGFSNVRLTRDMAWEWVEYLDDVIELIASFKHARVG